MQAPPFQGTAAAVILPAIIFRVFWGFRAYFSAMKSAYELAMERLGKSDPAEQPLTPEKKARLAEIDRVYKGKTAEREIFLKQQLDAALGEQKFDDADKIRKQMAGEKARLEEEREAEKVQVRRKR